MKLNAALPLFSLALSIIRRLCGFAGVKGVHDVFVHRYGQTKVVTLHIEVSARESVIKLHDLSEEVTEAIEKKLGGSAVVHIDPLSPNDKTITTPSCHLP